MNNEIRIHELYINDDETVVLSLAAYQICTMRKKFLQAQFLWVLKINTSIFLSGVSLRDRLITTMINKATHMHKFILQLEFV